MIRILTIALLAGFLLNGCVKYSEQVQIDAVRAEGSYGQEQGNEQYYADHPFEIYEYDGSVPSGMNVIRVLDKGLMKIVVVKDAVGKSRKATRAIAVERIGIRPTATGTKEVWAMIRNETDTDLQIEGRVSWFDQYQAPREGPGAWKRIILNANSVVTFTDMSTRPDSVYYMIDLREGR
ncbi:MAG: hypothetical protein D6B25_14885 [Desulfobulbaceae bacterium]|nr:MAG: hypothetical protein D6B25_14885 [Desulfobulbaceae bacterium]